MVCSFKIYVLTFTEIYVLIVKGPSPNYRLMQVTIAEWTRRYPFRASARNGHRRVPSAGGLYERHVGLTNHARGVVLINQSKCKISDNLETAPYMYDISSKVYMFRNLSSLVGKLSWMAIVLGSRSFSLFVNYGKSVLSNSETCCCTSFVFWENIDSCRAVLTFSGHRSLNKLKLWEISAILNK